MRILARPAFANRAFNPFNAELYGAMVSQGAVVEEYHPWSPLFARHDVVHVHWPESSFKHGLPGALLVTESLLLALKLAKRRGAKIVWTVHNLRAHGGRHPKWEQRMWDRFLPLVDSLHGLTEASLQAIREVHPVLARTPGFVVPHGHYRAAYPAGPGREAAREALGLPSTERVLLFLGQIFPYKNVPALLDAFRGLHGDDYRLVIAGKPRSAELAETLVRGAGMDARVLLQLGFVPDERLGVLADAADLVVLPYKEILNSGSALLALSFDRPVLMPAKGAAKDLQARVGGEWVMDYEGELTAETLLAALDRAQCLHGVAPLDSLGWDRLAAEMLAQYQAL